MRSLLIKVLALVVVTVVMGGLLVVEFDNVQFQSDHTYRALFTNVSGLQTGDYVKAAGVDVGRVNGLQLQRNNQILVTFTASTKVPVTRDTTLTVRYQDMLGNRYMEIDKPTGQAPALTSNETLPASQTQPALSLDALFNGFQPLFQGLQPAQINQLSAELVSVLQGEGGTIDGLLSTIGSLTNTLANRDQLIDSVIDNLNAVLGAVSQHDTQLNQLVVNLQHLITGLAADRNTIGNSFGDIANVSGTLAGLLENARPDISGTVTKVGKLSAELNKDSGVVNNDFVELPEAYQAISRQGLYGSFFNFYLCGIQIRLTGPDGPISTPMIKSQVQRCQG
ncbi:MAG TPA: MCE family protein [Streptosporangiaceae bacterium]|jgi:phospholipid/cholesterol/gamma-HCH transport system substrate-binding protein